MRAAVAVTILAAIVAVGVGVNAQGTKAPKWSVTYPAQATRIPALKSWLERQENALHAKFVVDAQGDASAAKASGYTANPYESDHKWSVVTETPRFVSLLVDRYDYTGGAHGMDTYATILWDKQAQRPLAPMAMFVSPAALSDAIRPAFCRQIDAERHRKRGGDFNPADKEFNQCLDPVREVVILGSSTRDRFDRIGIEVAPYDAGPYAEGSYEATVPVTPAVLAAVKPAWRGYFRVAGTP